MKVKNSLKKALACLLVAVLFLTAAPLASLSEIDLSSVTDWFSSTAQAAFDPSTLKIPGYNDYENVRYYVNKDHTASFIKIIDPSKVSGTYNIHSFGPFKITYINTYAFSNCTNVTYVGIPDTVVGIGYSAFNDTAYYKDESNWTNGVLYNGTYLLGAKTSLSGTYNVIDGTTCIAGNAFVNCTELTGITLPESLKYISQQAFWRSGLESVTIPDSVQTVSSNVFADCKSLSNVTIGSGLKRIGDYMFMNCPSLTSIKIPDNIESIGQYAFSACSYLETVEIGSGLSALGSNVFNACRRLKNLTVSPENTTFHSENNCLINTAEKTLVVGCAVGMIPEDGSVTKIGAHAFSGRSRSSIAVPDSVTAISTCAFADCTGTAVISLSKNLETIGISAFENCNYLVIMDFPKSLKNIYEKAFKGCTELTKIVIPTTVKSVYDEAFLNCTSLKSVTIGKGVSTIGAKAFGYCDDGESKISGFTIYGIPGTAAETYANENGFNFVQHNHTYKEVTTKEATCTETGEKALVCECGETSTSTIEKKSHTPSDWIVDVPETCTENGRKHKECTVCKTTLETKTIPAAGHKVSDWIVDVPATCTEDGSRHNVCTVCGITLESETIKKTGHNFEDKITAATCTSVGFESKICKNCGETQLIKAIPATGHKFVTKTVEPTCTSLGFETKVCETCGESHFVKSLPATGHKFVTKTVEPTCTSLGFETKVCETCGECLFVRSIPATGHSWEESEGKAPTCTESGLTAGKTCKVCGAVDSSVEEIAPLGHDIVVDSEAKSATCTESGLTEASHCTRCDFKTEATVVPALGHKIVVDSETKAATCTESGSTMSVHCERCDYKIESAAIPALGHCDENGDGKCDRCGKAVGTTTPEDPTPEDPTPEDPTKNCSCACHKSGIANFFFKIILVFQKLFKTNKTCKCGALHY